MASTTPDEKRDDGDDNDTCQDDPGKRAFATPPTHAGATGDAMMILIRPVRSSGWHWIGHFNARK